MAGIVESIPATSICSPSLFVVINWKCLVENAHHAWTGSENPKSHAGTPTRIASIIQIGSSLNITGSKPKNAASTVIQKTIQRVEVGGISSGGESLTKW